jgi:asparaginyl-tRNA synthetase
MGDLKLDYLACVSLIGTIVKSPTKCQTVELQVSSITLLGDCPADSFPLPRRRVQKEAIPLVTLRKFPVYRLRTDEFTAIMRVRHCLAMAIHQFFDVRGFLLIDTSDCEGAGEVFTVSPPKALLKPGESFFGKGQQAFLTVSGQLQGEAAALAFASIYTFGITCRAEESDTSRHAAAFPMVEPEVAFADLDDILTLGQDLIQFCIAQCLKKCPQELAYLAERRRLDKDKEKEGDEKEKDLITKLEDAIAKPFARVTYTEAIDILKAAVEKGVKFSLPPEWGMDLKSDHERYICEKVYDHPTAITHYPEELKAFYMHRCPPDAQGRRTVACGDTLLQGIGEVTGGSQREVRYGVLSEKMVARGMDMKAYQWYLDLRKYGSAPHAGFGLGFDRLLRYITGIDHIRDVAPFPVAYKQELA